MPPPMPPPIAPALDEEDVGGKVSAPRKLFELVVLESVLGSVFCVTHAAIEAEP